MLQGLELRKLKDRIVIIGGGAAGMLAAGHAGELGADVILIERANRLGTKLRISGKGRCNITNTASLNEFIEAFSPNGKFLYSSFSRFFREELLSLLESLGVKTKIERGGRVFPQSDSAVEVTEALSKWVYDSNVKVMLNTRAKGLVISSGEIKAVDIFGGRIDCSKVIITTGGASYPKTGSTGDGYELARQAGHTITPISPALSALNCSERWISELAGLSLKNVNASLIIKTGEKEKMLAQEFGEMLFTHNGLSGPIILTLSRGVNKLLQDNEVIISIDLKPALTEEQIHNRLISDFKHKRMFKNYLFELLPRLLAQHFPEIAGIDPDKMLNNITAVERNQIVERLKNLQVRVKSMASIDEAIVTAGGVSISEIDPKTMQSKLVNGLYFAGEVIDIDAKTGGFNLQAAFSTGWVAGDSAALL